MNFYFFQSNFWFIASIDKGTLNQCLWTAVGVFNSFPEDILFENIISTYSKTPIKNINFTKNLYAKQKGLKEYLYNYSRCDAISPTYTLPLYHHTKAYSSEGFYPVTFLDHNIASDEGFYQVLQFLSKIQNNQGYQIIVVDVGIFWRYYKWIYNPKILGYDRRMILLGNWHSYKELCLLIYQKHLRTLFGPILGQFSQSTLLLNPIGYFRNLFQLVYVSFPLWKRVFVQCNFKNWKFRDIDNIE